MQFWLDLSLLVDKESHITLLEKKFPTRMVEVAGKVQLEKHLEDEEVN